MTTQENTVNSGKAKSSAKVGLFFTAEELRTMHWDQGRTLSDIAHQHGVSVQAIKYWLDKYEIVHRSNVHDVLFEPSPALSYVYGVLHGDGFVSKVRSNCRLILSVTDEPFALSFKRACNCLGIQGTTEVNPGIQASYQTQYRVTASSVRFYEQWMKQSPAERLALGATFPADFARGLYESDGSVKMHRGNLELEVGKTNRLTEEWLYQQLAERNYTPKWHERELPSGKTFYTVSLYRQLDVRRFLAWVLPCIKWQPRTEANPEPSQDGDILEGVETTNSD